MEHVSKKFRKGELHDSLRDLIPALARRMLRRNSEHLGAQRDFWALQDISYEVSQGEVFGIVGANGAGKSTMLKLISRIMRPTSGSIEARGRVSALIEVSAGFHADLTGRENIYLNGAILGMRQRDIDAKFDDIVEFSGIAEFIDTPVKRYSSGMYARLGFSIAAHVDPDVLIVDEVLSVGDFVFQRKCVERMREVIRGGATVLFVSHNLKTIAEFCQRCMLLEHGRSVMIGPVGEVISTYLNRSRSVHEEDASSKTVRISSVKVRDEQGECVRFQSGQKAWIDVEVTASARCSKLSVSLSIDDDRFQGIFNTSTERLGYGNFDLNEGDVYVCTFELSLNLAIGIFYPTVLVYRYDTQTAYDLWEPAATIYVSSHDDVRGAAHCFPRVVRQEIHTASAGNIPTVRVISAATQAARQDRRASCDAPPARPALQSLPGPDQKR
jgi:homopolymeric O-antigen transport system ATP-binding protein